MQTLLGTAQDRARGTGHALCGKLPEPEGPLVTETFPLNNDLCKASPSLESTNLLAVHVVREF